MLAMGGDCGKQWWRWGVWLRQQDNIYIARYSNGDYGPAGNGENNASCGRCGGKVRQGANSSGNFLKVLRNGINQHYFHDSR